MQEVKVRVDRSEIGFVILTPEKSVVEYGPGNANVTIHEAVGKVFLPETYQELNKMEVGKTKEFTFTLS